jgi:gliding motility-associated-like protein
LISGSFIATGGEQYMIIGSFHDNATQNTTPLGPWGGSNEFAYYLIDDVTVILCQNIPPLSVEIIGNLNYCLGDTIEFNAQTTGGVPGYTYSWNAIPGDSNFIYAPNTTNTIILEVKDAMGNTAYDTLIVPNPTSLNVTVNSPLILCLGETYSIEANGAITYEWENGNSSPILTGIFEDESTIWVVGQSNGCRDTAIAQLIEDTLCEVNLILPNVFSPNGDGINDLFTESNGIVSIEKMEVYNRWGNLMLENQNSLMWDGTCNGKNCPEGVYYIIIYRKNRTGEIIQTMHWVTLLR